MAADLRGTARTLCTGFFYKGSQMALPWATPSTYGQAYTPVSCAGWESFNPSGLYGGHLLSPARRITRALSSAPCAARGQALAMGRCPHGKPAATAGEVVAVAEEQPVVRLLQASPSANHPRSHCICVNALPYGGYRVSSARSESTEGRGAAITECRL